MRWCVPAAVTMASVAAVVLGSCAGSSDGVVFGFKPQNRVNDPPVCSIENQNFDHSQIGADAAGTLYVANMETGVVREYLPDCRKLN
ncbi:MAG: hypothetical protein WB615_16305 [Candidatus Tumulicola sp.]